MLEAGTLSFDRVHLYSTTSHRGAGKFKLAQGGLGWKETSTGQVTTLPSADFAALGWVRAMRGYQLRIQLRDGSLYIFDGFPADALGELSEYAREHWGLTVEERPVSLKGWNWGSIALDGSQLEFHDTEGRLSFDLPLREVTNAVVSGRDEVAIEFAQAEAGTAAGADKKMDTVVEVRLYVPTTSASNKSDDDDEGDGDGDEDGKEGSSEGKEKGSSKTSSRDHGSRERVARDKDADSGSDDAATLAQTRNAARALCEKVKGFSTLNNAVGEMIATIPELPCIVPRGRFELGLGTNHLRLHGKSYDHRVLYSSIVKLFLLPKADDTHVLFVLALDPPLRQGQTRYPFVVFQFDRDEVINLTLENVDEETLRTRYEGKLSSYYESVPTFEVISGLFRSLTGQKIIVPGAFRGAIGGPSLKCALKANEGFLYPLERNFLFLPKPVTLIPHADVSLVEVARMGGGLGNPRSFDLRFHLRSGSEITLSNIAKEEYQGLEDFFKIKSIECRAAKGEDTGLTKKREQQYIDDDDDDGEGDDDGGLDGKRHRLDDEQGSSPDEDYQEDESAEDSEEGSDDYDEEEKEEDEEEEEDEDEDDEDDEDDNDDNY